MITLGQTAYQPSTRMPPTSGRWAGWDWNSLYQGVLTAIQYPVNTLNYVRALDQVTNLPEIMVFNYPILLAVWVRFTKLYPTHNHAAALRYMEALLRQTGRFQDTAEKAKWWMIEQEWQSLEGAAPQVRGLSGFPFGAAGRTRIVQYYPGRATPQTAPRGYQWRRAGTRQVMVKLPRPAPRGYRPKRLSIRKPVRQVTRRRAVAIRPRVTRRRVARARVARPRVVTRRTVPQPVRYPWLSWPIRPIRRTAPRPPAMPQPPRPPTMPEPQPPPMPAGLGQTLPYIPEREPGQIILPVIIPKTPSLYPGPPSEFRKDDKNKLLAWIGFLGLLLLHEEPAAGSLLSGTPIKKNGLGSKKFTPGQVIEINYPKRVVTYRNLQYTRKPDTKRFTVIKQRGDILYIENEWGTRGHINIKRFEYPISLLENTGVMGYAVTPKEYKKEWERAKRKAYQVKAEKVEAGTFDPLHEKVLKLIEEGNRDQEALEMESGISHQEMNVILNDMVVKDLIVPRQSGTYSAKYRIVPKKQVKAEVDPWMTDAPFTAQEQSYANMYTHFPLDWNKEFAKEAGNTENVVRKRLREFGVDELPQELFEALERYRKAVYDGYKDKWKIRAYFPPVSVVGPARYPVHRRGKAEARERKVIESIERARKKVDTLANRAIKGKVPKITIGQYLDVAATNSRIAFGKQYAMLEMQDKPHLSAFAHVFRKEGRELHHKLVEEAMKKGKQVLWAAVKDYPELQDYDRIIDKPTGIEMKISKRKGETAEPEPEPAPRTAPATMPQQLRLFGSRMSFKLSDPSPMMSKDWIAAQIRKAVEEDPGRRVHGDTRYNAFFITPEREIVPFNRINELRRTDPAMDTISVHSHSGNNWKQYISRTGNLEPFNPLNDMDVKAFQQMALRGMANTDVLIMADGRMEILHVPPESQDNFTSLNPQSYRMLRPTHEQYATVWAREGKQMHELDRDRLRQFAERHKLVYLPDERWLPPEPEPFVKEKPSGIRKTFTAKPFKRTKTKAYYISPYYVEPGVYPGIPEQMEMWRKRPPVQQRLLGRDSK